MIKKITIISSIAVILLISPTAFAQTTGSEPTYSLSELGGILEFFGISIGGAGGTGAPGADGQDGADGTNGIDGSNCTTVSNASGALITCEDGTESQINHGEDGTGGGGSGSQGEQGIQGEQGPAGESCTTTELPLGNVAIVCGDTSSILLDGQQGPAGATGADGQDGTTSIVQLGEGNLENIVYPNLLAGEERVIADYGSDIEINKVILTLTDNVEIGGSCIAGTFGNEGVTIRLAETQSETSNINRIPLVNTGNGNATNCNFFGEVSSTDANWPAFQVSKISLHNGNGGDSTITDFPKLSVVIFTSQVP